MYHYNTKYLSILLKAGKLTRSFLDKEMGRGYYILNIKKKS